MNILYIGQMVPEDKIGKCTGYSVAGDMMQKNILKELMYHREVENIYIISVLPNAAFPKDKIWIKQDESQYYKSTIHNLSYCNIPVIKQCYQKHQIYKTACLMAKNNKIDCIVCYNMYVQFGKAALKLEKKLNIPLIPILADLPVENILKESNFFYRCQQRIIKKNTLENIRKVKHAIVLNKNAADYMIEKRDYIVIPGGVDKKQNYTIKQRKELNRKIVYAGTLSSYSGILNLISAVIQSDIQDATLEIYGDGELKDEIIQITKKNSLIKYMGKKNIDDMRKIMEGAWILTNPRSVADPVSAISFPSKLFEYIMCGRPVVTTVFSGMPENIKKIVYSCGNGTIDEIKVTLKQMDRMSEETLNRSAEEAYRYVVNEMNWNKQVEKIFLYIQSIL